MNMDKITLSKDDLLKKTGKSATLAIFFIIMFLLLAVRQLTHGPITTNNIIAVVVFGAMTALCVFMVGKSKRDVKNDKIQIYVDKVLDKRISHNGKHTKCKMLFANMENVKPNTGGWIRVPKSDFNYAQFGADYYIIIIGDEKAYSTKIFPVAEYELSDELMIFLNK